MTEPELIEDFFGVYLLYSINPKFKGRTYIGYTRDPNRRILQHNRGTWAGGAFRTKNKGPWKMALIVHGFPNNICALRFEWAWQNPTKTIRLQHLNLKRVPRKESEFQFKLRILSEMLRIGPWCRLPLLIRWLKNDFRENFSIDKKPPDHMIVCSGSVKSRNLQKNPSNVEKDEDATCSLCSEGITDPRTKLKCINQSCQLIAHIVCLAKLFLEPGEYVPVNGTCPFCCTNIKWGDLIRKLKGCSQESTNGPEETSDVDDEIDSPDAQDSSCVRVSLNDSDFEDKEILKTPGSPNASISSHYSVNADALIYPHIPASSSVSHSNPASTSTSKTNTHMVYDNFDWHNCENDLW